MYLLLGCAIFVGVLNRLVDMYRTHLIVNAGRTMDRSEIPPSNGFFGKVSVYYQKYLGIPALFGHKHVHSYNWFCIPTRLESLLVNPSTSLVPVLAFNLTTTTGVHLRCIQHHLQLCRV